MAGERGSTLIEILVALGIIAVALTVFLAALQLGLRGVANVQEQTLAASLARSQMESVKAAPWPGPYPALAAPSGYTVTTTPESGPLPGLQLITVTVSRHGRPLLTIQGYKGPP